MPGLRTKRVVFIGSSVWEEMVSLGKSFLPAETGGILVGYRSEAAMVVTQVIGPGPAATHKLTSFDPDTQWQTEELAARYHASGRTETYLGDWHTHPNGNPRASFADWRAARRISRARAARAPEPLILIIGLDEEAVTACAYRYWAGVLWSCRLIIDSP